MIKLEKYLANYLRTEFERQECDDIFSVEMMAQALDAFESTENTRIHIKPIPTECLDCPRRIDCEALIE